MRCPGCGATVPSCGCSSPGRGDEATKASVYRSVDVFVAPNTGGESFGIILLEAMAAGTPIVASDLDAFRRVLDSGTAGAAGAVATAGDAESLAHACASVLGSPARQQALRAAGRSVVARYDWSVVGREILR